VSSGREKDVPTYGTEEPKQRETNNKKRRRNKHEDVLPSKRGGKAQAQGGEKGIRPKERGKRGFGEQEPGGKPKKRGEGKKKKRGTPGN